MVGCIILKFKIKYYLFVVDMYLFVKDYFVYLWVFNFVNCKEEERVFIWNIKFFIFGLLVRVCGVLEDSF